MMILVNEMMVKMIMMMINTFSQNFFMKKFVFHSRLMICSFVTSSSAAAAV